MRGFLISGKYLNFYGHLNTALSVNIEDDPLLPTDPQPKFVHHHRTVGFDTIDLHDRGHCVHLHRIMPNLVHLVHRGYCVLGCRWVWFMELEGNGQSLTLCRIYSFPGMFYQQWT